MKITVITADIIESRKNPDYNKQLTDELLKLRHPGIISPFSISRGDEIQGVVEGWLMQPELIRNLRYICRPCRLRIGIGIGFTGPELINSNSWSMNGPAFHLARSAVEEAHKLKGSSTVIKTGMDEFDSFINCICLLIDTIQKKWTDEQWEAVQAYEKWGTYEEASKYLDIAMQNVQKRCKAANWKQLSEAENTLKNVQSFLESLHPLKGENDNFTF
ncbi:MAG: SatD family protein [Desulfitobacterium hafniense]|nr:SatD family protein [Desulfitobacterium hafniense]